MIYDFSVMIYDKSYLVSSFDCSELDYNYTDGEFIKLAACAKGKHVLKAAVSRQLWLGTPPPDTAGL